MLVSLSRVWCLYTKRTTISQFQCKDFEIVQSFRESAKFYVFCLMFPSVRIFSAFVTIRAAISWLQYQSIVKLFRYSQTILHAVVGFCLISYLFILDSLGMSIAFRVNNLAVLHTEPESKHFLSETVLHLNPKLSSKIFSS